MRTDPDPEDAEALLEAMLRDEDWQRTSASFKAEALRAFSARQRIRCLTRWVGGGAVLVVLVAAAGFWVGRPASAPRPVMMAPVEALKPPAKPRLLTDAELVAAFPKGSCFIAEVDGRKELVFFDPKVERACLARTGATGN